MSSSFREGRLPRRDAARGRSRPRRCRSAAGPRSRSNESASAAGRARWQPRRPAVGWRRPRRHRQTRETLACRAAGPRPSKAQESRAARADVASKSISCSTPRPAACLAASLVEMSAPAALGSILTKALPAASCSSGSASRAWSQTSRRPRPSDLPARDWR